jgi:hypothetical protein
MELIRMSHAHFAGADTTRTSGETNKDIAVP